MQSELGYKYNSSYGAIKYDIKGEGQPLILVHGTPWSSYNWRKVIPALSQWFTVYYYDLPGYGQSEKNIENVSLGIQNDALKELIDFWKLDNPKIVGHDFGGATVLRTHLLNKQPFQKILLIDPVAVSPWGSPFFSHVAHHESAFADLPGNIHDALLTRYIEGATYTPMDRETLLEIKKPWSGKDGQAAFYRQIAQSDRKYTDEAEALYHEIKVPVFLIWGEDDQWIPVERGIELHRRIKSSEFVTLPQTGHLVQEDQPALLVSYILKFMEI
ncbi:alpha/beta hydrolase [Geovibrio thiophilus]|uniref:Alpha/beta hydrolase n=1 Tax=Geovibrio thiophilus TaxID=139438 RepID=A0A3R5UZ45_9BACT|nr:alpha/beta hydrolase [Geovibrio thiophilus]QAR33345.1 alpha/beta hydrolase [Geovibrio thiophilus]